MEHPIAGGRYVRDPKTGTLLKTDAKAPAVQPSSASPLPEPTQPETEVAPVTTMKKGK